jgi:hypothetical protein
LAFKVLVAVLVLCVLGGLAGAIVSGERARSFRVACVQAGGLPALYEGRSVCFADPAFLDIAR